MNDNDLERLEVRILELKGRLPWYQDVCRSVSCLIADYHAQAAVAQSTNDQLNNTTKALVMGEEALADANESIRLARQEAEKDRQATIVAETRVHELEEILQSMSSIPEDAEKEMAEAEVDLAEAAEAELEQVDVPVPVA